MTLTQLPVVLLNGVVAAFVSAHSKTLLLHATSTTTTTPSISTTRNSTADVLPSSAVLANKETELT